MELWIRTQDKEGLLKINRGIMYWLVENKRHTIVNQENEAGLSIVAEYKSKERAWEVLDEIQSILHPKPLLICRPSEEMVELLGSRQVGKTMKMKQDFEFKELSTYVYEMPKE